MNLKHNSKALTKILAIAMTLVMVFGMVPAITFAADEVNEGETIVIEEGAPVNEELDGEKDDELIENEGDELLTVNLEANEALYDVEFKGLHSAQINSLKVYTCTINDKGEPVKGDVDLLEGISTEPDDYKLKYKTQLAEGKYYVEAYDANNYCNGAIVVSVLPEGNNVFTIYRAYEIYATNSGWVDGTDYEIEFRAEDADGVARITVPGKTDSWGTMRTTGIFLDGDVVSAVFTPIGDKAEGFLPLTVRKTAKQTNTNVSLSGKVPAILAITVNAPKGSTINAGTFGTYYVYEFYEPVSVKETADGITAVINVPETSANHFLRVQNPDGVTYWNFYKWTAAQEITITKEDLHIGDESFTKDTIYRFEKNVYDRAGIYLNINAQGYLNLDEGDTFELNVFRNWMAIESFFNAKVALPDMHYEVVDENGNPSDVVEIVPDKFNSSVANLVANKKGVAIVKVTYDAMTHMQAQSLELATGVKTNREFSAIWPELTGVFVVSVGEENADIETNMLIERAETTGTKESAIDAEHDILFYLDEEGATFSFTPEEGSTVSVDRSLVGDKMTFTGFTTDGITVDSETGEVTVENLKTGRHIIKVEKDGLATYQVVTAREVSYVMLDADGNEIDKDTELKPGDTVSLQFSNLISPKEKLSGVYNFNFSLYYHDENNKFFRSVPGGNFGVYDFSGNPARQLIKITIPEDWEGTTYTLTGNIKQAGFPGVPTHRVITYRNGTNVVFDSIPTEGILSVLPEITLKLEGYNEEMAKNVDDLISEIGDPVQVKDGELIAKARAAYENLTEAQKELVTKLDKLEALEADYDVLMAAEAEKLINALPDAGKITAKDKEAVEKARAAYDNLTEAQKELVSANSLKKLENAEKALVPKTGDSMNVIWFTLVMFTAAVVAVVSYKKLKKA